MIKETITKKYNDEETLYFLLGQPVYANANLHGRTEFTLDVSSWPAGLYLLQLTFPNGEQATRKVVKD